MSTIGFSGIAQCHLKPNDLPVQWVGWAWVWVFRGPAATLNDLQMAQMGSRCDCMIKLYTKNSGREIPKNLGRPLCRYALGISSSLQGVCLLCVGMLLISFQTS